jgi:hypothetical protein
MPFAPPPKSLVPCRYRGSKEEEDQQLKAARRLGKALFQHVTLPPCLLLDTIPSSFPCPHHHHHHHHHTHKNRYRGSKEEEDQQLKAARRLGKALFQHVKGDPGRSFICREDFDPFFAGLHNAEAEADAAFFFFDKVRLSVCCVFLAVHVLWKQKQTSPCCELCTRA